MKTNYLFAFLIASTVTFSACDSSNTQGAGSNADGSCNSSIQADAQTFVNQMMSAETAVDADEASAAMGYGNFGDLESQLSTAESECDTFAAKYGSTVCTSTDGNGNTQTFDGSQLTGVCAQMSMSSTCDSNYLNAVMNVGMASTSVSAYINDDGTLNNLGQSEPSMFAAAAMGLSAQCDSFEASYQNAGSCSVTVGANTYPVNNQTINTLCSEVKTAEAQSGGLGQSMNALKEIQDTTRAMKTSGQIKSLTVILKKSGI